MPRQIAPNALTAFNAPASATPVSGRPTDIAAWTAAIVGSALSLRGVAAAELMQRLKLDEDCVAAAHLTVLPSNADTDALVLETFGASISQLFIGVHRMASMQGLSKTAATATATVPVTAAQRAQQTEALRKMLLAMVDDVRVVLIKLAERLISLRSAALSAEARRTESAQAEARQVMDIFAPLANRLGVWQIKWELEDLSLRLLQPTQYHAIARYLDETRIEREAYIDTTKAVLRDALQKAGITGEITGRSKHIYSIYDKLQRKRCAIEELYDIRAIRVIVAEMKDCYATLGVVHSMFQPIPGEFDDYIAKPKANHYRSLHTSVLGPHDRALEVQIRTQAMHQASELGVAAHWSYKEGGGASKDADQAAYAGKIASLRQVLTWGNELGSPGALLAGFKASLFEDTIFVLTPQGKIIDLPKDSTPLDFAYAVHSGLGHRCRGAKVDGAMVPLNTPLKNGQRVEVSTVKEGGPSRDWLNPDTGYLRSHRARAKVRQYFNGLELAETLAHGRVIVEKDLQRHGQTALSLDKLAHEAGFKSQDEFFAAAGRAEVTTRDLDVAIRKAAGLIDSTVEPLPRGSEVHTSRSRAKSGGGGILVVGVDKLMTGLAQCCKPVPPDPIVGFVTRLKGITIHRADCANVIRMTVTEPRRIIEADWGDAAQNDLFSVQVEVMASDRQGLLRDISDVLARAKINVTAVNTLTRDFMAKMKFTAEVKTMDQLKVALAQVSQIKGVQNARRI